jgi:hypothetical protein
VPARRSSEGKSAALRRQRPLVRIQSTRRRRHSSAGRALVRLRTQGRLRVVALGPKSCRFLWPPWRDWTRNGLLSRRMLVRIEPGALSADTRRRHASGGLTEREGARLLSEGRGRPRQRSIRCPSALEGMPRWLGAPCFENSDTALPWGFDTSTFRPCSRPVRPAVGRLPLTQRTQVRVLHGSPAAGVAHPGPSCRQRPAVDNTQGKPACTPPGA